LSLTQKSDKLAICGWALANCLILLLQKTEKKLRIVNFSWVSPQTLLNSCPSRDVFKEPDSSLPLKCDMCEEDPPLEEPLCVKWCINDALTYEEVEEEVKEEAKLEDMEIGLESLVNTHGLQQVIDAIARMSTKGEHQGDS